MNRLQSEKPLLVLVLLGTGGDVWPPLQLAAVLRKRGYAVLVAAYAQFEADVRAMDLEFHAVGTRDEYLAQMKQPEFWTSRGPSMSIREGGYVRLAIPRVFELVTQLQARRPVLICTRNAYGARFAAERYGLRCIGLTYSPQQLITPDRLPYPLATPLVRALPRWYRHLGLALGDRANLNLLRDPLNALRCDYGLAPIRNLRQWLFFGTSGLALYPRWFDDLTPLTGAGIRQGDFTFRHTDESSVADSDLARFLSGGSPPVLCTFGTGIAHASSRYGLVAEALKRIGRRGVFVTPFAENVLSGLSDTMLRVDYADLAAVLPRCSLLIHHGGIGTAAQALRAGLPQLVWPFAYDQPDNGDRIERLGAGELYDAKRIEVRTLADAMLRTMALPTEPLQRLRATLLSSDGAATCADAFETLLSEPRPTRNTTI